MVNKIYNFFKKDRKMYFLFSFIVIVFLVIFFVFTPKTHATSSDKVYGYAWSSNTGWISFNNCVDPNNASTCNGQAYGVDYNSSTGLLSGYAWSENIGWIKFGGLSSFPSGTGTTAANATLALTGANIGKLTGWARACAGTSAGDCSSMTSRTDGWDGWVSLSGTGYGVSFNATTGNANTPSYAWGSDVVDWIDFTQADITPILVNTGASVLSFSSPDAPCVLTSNPNASFLWSTTGMTSCSMQRDGVTLTPPPAVLVNSSGTIFPVNSPSSTFRLACLDSTGITYYSSSIAISVNNNCQTPPVNKKPKIIEK